MGHEYGHILDRHHERKIRGVPADEATVHGEEYQTDAIGFILMASAQQHARVPLLVSFLGVQCLFLALTILERAMAVLRTGRAELRSTPEHPAPILRRDHLRQRLSGMLPEPLRAEALELIRSSLNLHGQLATFWLRLEPVVQRLHDAGARPAPIWVE